MTDPKRSLRVPTSPRAEASVSASACFCLRLPPLSLSASGISSLALFLALGCSLSLTPFSALGVVPSALPCVSLCLSLTVSLAFPLASSIPAQSVCLSVSKSLVPSKLWDPPSWQGTVGPQEEKRSPGLSARGLPAPAPSQLGPVDPARSHLVSPVRAATAAATAAAIYARRGRSWSFKQRFPGARRGPTVSLMAPVAANHAPLPPPARPAGAAERLSA